MSRIARTPLIAEQSIATFRLDHLNAQFSTVKSMGPFRKRYFWRSDADINAELFGKIRIFRNTIVARFELVATPSGLNINFVSNLYVIKIGNVLKITMCDFS